MTSFIEKSFCRTVLLTIVAVLVVSGCAKKKIGLQPIDEDQWFVRESRSALTSKAPSEFTLRFLRKQDLWDVYEKDPIAVLTTLEHDFALMPDRDPLFVLMELCFAEAKKTDPVTKETAKLYRSCMWHAYTYLFDPKLKPPLNTYSPRFRRACDFYNRALAKLLVYHDEQDIRLKERDMMPMFKGQILWKGVQSELSWNLKELNQFHVVYNYEVTGLQNHYQASGIGVPLILDRNLPPPGDRSVNEQFLSPYHQICAGTAVLHFDSSGHDIDHTDFQVKAFLSIYDPVQTDKTDIDKKLVPLETDFTTPIAYFFEKVPSLKGTTGFFEPEAWTDMCGLYMTQQYQPGKIPVVFVHGLFTTTRTWIVMFNELIGDPLLRERYQFWFFLYPTGNPIGFSAVLLRDALKEVREVLDPTGKDAAFDRMVLVGHSMGGILSRIMVQHSNNIVYDALFDRPIDELDIGGDERELLRRMVFFEPLPFVRRVIFMATPHRGSELARNRLANFGLSIVKLPGEMVDFVTDITPFLKPELEKNPNYPKKRVPTGFHGLRPESIVSQTVDNLPIDANVIYHSIIGNNVSADTPGGSDGIVTYESAHLEGAASERIVRSNHNVHVNPAAVLEVRRILYEHIRGVE